MIRHLLPAVLVGIALSCASTIAWAGDAHRELPEDHAYQRVLRAYLQAQDDAAYAVKLTPFAWSADDAESATADELGRLWMLSLKVPPFQGITAPASAYTLDAIEADDAVKRPPGSVIPFAWLATWDHPMNPYFDSETIKRRALAGAIVDMVMTDGLHELSGDKDWLAYGRLAGIREDRAAHSDCLGGTLIWLAYVNTNCIKVAPREVQKAYAQGLAKLVRRMIEWGPTRLMTDMDLFASVSLSYLLQSSDDPALREIAADYRDMLYTDPHYFNKAGYWVDIQGYDASYNGISIYFSTWAALVSDSPIVREAADAAQRLKSYLALPEPDGSGYVAPVHFSPRTSADSLHDQWRFPERDPGVAMLSDHAQYLVDVPDDDALRQVPGRLVSQLQAMVDNAKPIAAKTWWEDHWTHELNFASTYYRPGYIAHRRMLEQSSPQLLRPPFEREGEFVETFGDSMVVAKFKDYGAVFHIGSVGEAEKDWPTRAKWMPREKLFGFSGGALSAFWTPTAGAAILGRRGGAQGQTYDTLDAWRTWPFHVVAGQTKSGTVFTSGRILKPTITQLETSEAGAHIALRGHVPQTYVTQASSLTGQMIYSRTFDVTSAGVRVETQIESDGKDDIVELCELIPVFIALRGSAENEDRVTIRIKAGDAWQDATTAWSDGVTSIDIERFDGHVHINFDRPRRVKLSPEVWQDQYQTRSTCRTLLVDLRGDDETFTQAKVAYTISPAK